MVKTILDFVENSRLNNLQYSMTFLWKPWNVFKGCVEKRHFLYIGSRDDQIAIHAKLLTINYEFYGFSGDLIETIN